MEWVDAIEQKLAHCKRRYMEASDAHLAAVMLLKEGPKLIAAVRLAEAELDRCQSFPSDTHPSMAGPDHPTEWWYGHIDSLQYIQQVRVRKVITRLRNGDVEGK